jgi:hypothetical protein
MIRTIAALGLTAAMALGAVGAASAAPAGKVTICHHTASETNPVVIITISENAVGKHYQNHGHTGPDEEFIDGQCGGEVLPQS